LKNLELGNLEYKIVEEFLADLKKKFGERDEKVMKVVELRKLEQEGMMIKKFVQEFRRTAKECGYEARLLVEEFKREINKGS